MSVLPVRRNENRVLVLGKDRNCSSL